MQRGFRLRQDLRLRATLDLEHADRVGPRDQVKHGRIVEGQAVEIWRAAGGLRRSG